MVFPADDATCRRMLLIGNLHPAVNTDQVRLRMRDDMCVVANCLWWPALTWASP